jgi:hypothetical protein
MAMNSSGEQIAGLQEVDDVDELPEDGSYFVPDSTQGLECENKNTSELFRALAPRQLNRFPPDVLQAARDALKIELAKLVNLHQDCDAWVTNDCLERYLRAEKGNVKSAAKRIAATLKWRQEIRPEELQCRACMEDHRNHDARFIGFDLYLRPCIYSCFAASKGREPTALITHFIMLVESCCQKMQGAETLVWIVDFRGFKVKDALDPRFSISLVKLLQAHYPERMAHIVCIDAPAAFSGLWMAVKSLMDEKTRSKVLFFREPRIAELFAALFEEQIATFLEGECAKNRDKAALKATWAQPHKLPLPCCSPVPLPSQLRM